MARHVIHRRGPDRGRGPAIGPRGRRQRGAALLTALVIVGLIATLGAGMVWQQWRAVQVESAERARVQAYWVLTGALDWARLILREDGRSGNNPPVDHLGEPWATPLAEARLSTFLAVDKNDTGDAPEAFLSGVITDEQSKFNLRTLIGSGVVIPERLAVLKRLCEIAGVSQDVAPRLAENIRQAVLAAADTDPAGQQGTGGVPGSSSGADGQQVVQPIGDHPPLMPSTVDDLTWLGLDRDTIDKLRPYVTLLPEVATWINVNTAPKEVLAAAIPHLDLASAERLVQHRQGQPFKSLGDVEAVLGRGYELGADILGTTSQFFIVQGRLRFEDRVVQQRYLVYRSPSNDVTTLHEERAASIEGLAAASVRQR